MRYLLIFVITVITTLVLITYTPLNRWLFNRETEPPQLAPMLIAPANQAKNQVLTITLSWSKVEKATFYLVSIRDLKTNSTVLDTSTRNTSLALGEGLLKENHSYIWIVAGGNQAGNGPFSEVREFTTKSSYAIFKVSQPDKTPLAGIKVKVVGLDLTYAILVDKTGTTDAAGIVTFDNFQLKTAVIYDPRGIFYPYVFSLETKTPPSITYNIVLKQMSTLKITRARTIYQSNMDINDFPLLNWQLFDNFSVSLSNFLSKKEDVSNSLMQMLIKKRGDEAPITTLLLAGPIEPASGLVVRYPLTPVVFFNTEGNIAAAERLLAQTAYESISREVSKMGLNKIYTQLNLKLYYNPDVKLVAISWQCF